MATLDMVEQLMPLFDKLTDTAFFTKDTEGRYTSVNDLLVTRCGCQSRRQLLGKRPSDIFPGRLAGLCERQDREVLKGGRPLEDVLEPCIKPTPTVSCSLTHKFPLYSTNGTCIGLYGMSKDIRHAPGLSIDVDKLKRVIDHVKDNLSKPPSVHTLAELAGMSVYQLDLRMKHIFGLTTGQWVLQQRIGLARSWLTSTEATIADIAQVAGYSDQSAFSRHFKKVTGHTPKRFRAAFGPSGGQADSGVS